MEYLDLIEVVLQFVIALLALPVIKRYRDNTRLRWISEIAETAYYAVSNYKRQYEKNKGEKLSSPETQELYRLHVKTLFRQRGLKLDDETLRALQIEAEALHQTKKIETGEI